MRGTVDIGSGAHRYRYERDWAKLPRGWSFGSTDPAAMPPRTALKGAVDGNGDVYVVSRSAHPICVFDSAGQFVTAWGEGRFSDIVHSVAIAPDGAVWVIDSGHHLLTRHTKDGALLDSYGTKGIAAPTFHGNPFNMPTHIAFHPNGDAYVSDGYGNRRVHRFGPDGVRKFSWGEPGNGPGQFALVHFIAIDAAGTIYITDRRTSASSCSTRTANFWPIGAASTCQATWRSGARRSMSAGATGCRSGRISARRSCAGARTSHMRGLSTSMASGWIRRKISILRILIAR